MSNMTNTEKDILDAAVRMFSRYGVKRTSMGDLAKEASVSRQTLYNTYKNKDDVLKALIRFFTDNTLCEIEVALHGARTLDHQLDIVFDKMTVAGFDLVETTPNAQDLIDGFNCAGMEEQQVSAEKFRIVLERILTPHRAAFAKVDLTPATLSDFLQRSAKSAGHTARDRKHLLAQLHTLKQLCLAAADKIVDTAND